MNNKLLLSTLAVVGTAVIAGSTFAFMGNGGNSGPKNLDNTTHEQVQEAFKNGDFSAFQSTTSESNRFSQMTEERFNEVVARRKERTEHREKVQKAIEDVDFEAWKSIQDNEKMLEIIDTEDKFKKLVELHKLREQAKVLSEELGLPERGMKNGQNRMGKKGMRGGNGQNQGRRGNGGQDGFNMMR